MDAPDLGTQLVTWNGCRIRADLLIRVRAAYEAMNPRDVADVSHVVEDAVRGKDVLAWEDLPPRVLALLG